MTKHTKASAHTLKQVREILDKVAARCGDDMAAKVLRDYGNAGKPVVFEELNPKRFGRVIDGCNGVLERAAAKEQKEAAEAKALAEIETEGKIVASLAEKIRNTEQEAVKAVEDKLGKSTTLRMELVQRLHVMMPKLKVKGSPMSYKDFKSKYVGSCSAPLSSNSLSGSPRVKSRSRKSS